MNCDDFQENASRFMDGVLDASGQARLFAHLSTCSDCRSFLQSSVRVREAIGKDPTTLPAGIDEVFFEQLSSRHVLREMPQHRPPSLWRREVRFPFAIAAAAVLVVAMASVLLSLLFLRSSANGPTLESVFARGAGASGRQAVVVIYQMPEEQVVTPAPAKMYEVRARAVAN